MASELLIRLSKPVEINKFQVEIGRHLSNLLSTEFPCGVFIHPGDNIHLNENKNLIVSLENYPDHEAELTFIFQEPVKGYEDPDEDGWWGIVTIRAASNDPVKHVLSAAIALALSRMNNSRIRDESRVWTNSMISTYEEFAERLKILEAVNGIEESMTKFLQKINSADP